MAALVDFNDYKNRLFAPRDTVPVSKVAIAAPIGRTWDWWIRANVVGVAPTTAVVPTRTLLGAMGQENAAAEELFVLGGHLGGNAGMHILCDRLSHQGGLSGIVTTANVTTNLPTAALTRYTSGEGVIAAISIYTAVGTTATTITCTYTNQDGTGGRVSPPMTFGSTNFREASRLMSIPLMAGDTGVRSIESSTLLASTVTAGAFGYTLYKPLMAFCFDRDNAFGNFSLVDGGMAGGLPPILDEACLFWVTIAGAASIGLVGQVPFTAV